MERFYRRQGARRRGTANATRCLWISHSKDREEHKSHGSLGPHACQNFVELRQAALHHGRKVQDPVLLSDAPGMPKVAWRPFHIALTLSLSFWQRPRPLRLFRPILSFQSAGMEGGTDGVYNSIHPPIVRI